MVIGIEVALVCVHALQGREWVHQSESTQEGQWLVVLSACYTR